jgi:hypothetical protein
LSFSSGLPPPVAADAAAFFNAEAPPPNLPQEIEPDPKMPPPEDGAALDPDGKPATGTDPVPQS